MSGQPHNISSRRSLSLRITGSFNPDHKQTSKERVLVTQSNKFSQYRKLKLSKCWVHNVPPCQRPSWGRTKNAENNKRRIIDRLTQRAPQPVTVDRPCLGESQVATSCLYRPITDAPVSCSCAGQDIITLLALSH